MLFIIAPARNLQNCGLKIHSFLLLLGVIHTCMAACYFSEELQGQFLMQSAVMQGAAVSYSQVNISAEAIPIWGQCHRRIGNNVILMDSSGGTNCIRCFHLNLRSRNVLQVHTEGLDKCYTNEDAAEATCPDEATLRVGDDSKEILLYKTKDLSGEQIRQEYCPINGRFTFTYRGGNEDCPVPESELDNCPSGSALNFRYRSCTFGNYDNTYLCLGHWAGPDNQRYLALLNRSPNDRHPRYRCALYREEPGTGNIFMAFSSDSTCRSDLHSAVSGYVMLGLAAVPAPEWPEQVYVGNCRFPGWALGHWQDLYVEDKMFTYKDHSTFKTYTVHCLGPDVGVGERFLVFARTQCGEEMYNCVWLKNRGINVLEFQMGVRTSTDLNNSLCADSNFHDNTWITQGRLERLQETPCPIAGEYTGVIPDSSRLCARLSSDCKSPEIMYYTVSDCLQDEVYEGSRRRGRKRRQTGTKIYHISNPRSTTSTSSSVPVPQYRDLASNHNSYPTLHQQNQQNNDTDVGSPYGSLRHDEREYRCLGQWQEDGLMYTYTQRRDVGTYECFVGSIVSKDEIYIKEAGDHCQRNINPLQYGMKLTRKGSCFGGQMSSGSPQRPHPTSSWLSSRHPPEPTKPWKPITAPPRGSGGNQSSASWIMITNYGIMCSISLLLFRL